MTGRLGVLRIGRDYRLQPGPHSGNLADTKFLTGRCFWDTTEYEQTYGGSGIKALWKYTTYGTTEKSQAETNLLDVFYLPVRFLDSKTKYKGIKPAVLSGLLLLPTGKKKGKFRRVGMFEVGGDLWMTGPVGKFTDQTDILDSRFFMKKRGNGDYTVSIV
jgi:hypothetical protein